MRIEEGKGRSEMLAVKIIFYDDDGTRLIFVINATEDVVLPCSDRIENGHLEICVRRTTKNGIRTMQ